MPAATKKITITLHDDVLGSSRDEVFSGVNASESGYVESILLSEALFEPAEQDELALTALHRF